MTKRNSILLVWSFAITLCLGYILSQVNIVTNISQFMPTAKTLQERLLLDQLNKGLVTRLILIAVEGQDESQLAKISRELAAQLRLTQLFLRVDNGENLISEKEKQQFFKYRYLLDKNTRAQAFEVNQLRQVFEQRLLELSSPAATFSQQHLRDDPSNAFINVITNLTNPRSTQARSGLWFSADKQRALLLAETKEPGYELRSQQVIIDTIRHQFASLAPTESALTLLLSGPSVFALNSRDTIRSETQYLSILASIAILLITIAAFRSVRVVLISGLPLLSAIIVATVGVNLVFGEVHGITLAFGITLLGVAIDYPIHIFSHLRKDTPVVHNIQAIWPTLRLGIFTTTAAYLAMISPAFTGLAQLGLFAMLGLLTAAVFTRWVLPTLLPSHWAPTHNVDVNWVNHLLLAPSKTRLVIASVICFMGIIAIWQSKSSLWEYDLAALSPIPKKAIALDNLLREDLGATGVNEVLVIAAQDIETALQNSEQVALQLDGLVNNNFISAYDFAARYLPSKQTQLSRQAALPSPEQLRQSLLQALQPLPFDASQFEPFITAVAASKSLALLAPQDITGTTLGVRVSSLLYFDNNQWMAVIPLAGVSDEAAILAWLAQQNNPQLHYLNIKSTSTNLIKNYQGAATTRIGISCIIILIVLWLGLKSFRKVARVVLPVLLAIILDVFILGVILGEKLTLFHMVALLLVFGIGIDYSLFFGRSNQVNRHRRQTAYALFICVLSTVCVFGILAFSNTPVLAYLGKSVAIGVVLCFLSAMLLSQHHQPKSVIGDS